LIINGRVYGSKMAHLEFFLVKLVGQFLQWFNVQIKEVVYDEWLVPSLIP